MSRLQTTDGLTEEQVDLLGLVKEFGADGTEAGVQASFEKAVQQLRDLILALGVSEARMDQGNLRADVNLSLAPMSSGTLGTRTAKAYCDDWRRAGILVRRPATSAREPTIGTLPTTLPMSPPAPSI